MAARIDIIADAVVAALSRGVQANRFVLSFEPQRVDVVDFSLITKGLQVYVLGLEEELQGTNKDDDVPARDTDAVDMTIEIVVLQQLEKAQLATEVSKLKELAEQILHFLRGTDGDLSSPQDPEDEEEDVDAAPVEFIRSKLSPLYDHARLRRKLLFVSDQEIVYRDYRNLGGGDIQ